MDECEPRLIRAGLPQLHDNRKSAVFLVLLMFVSVAQPVTADSSISRDDFDVLDALMETLNMRKENGEAEIANSLAESALSAVDAAARPVGDDDPLTVANKFLDNVSMRDSSAYEVDHPRPYEFLMDRSTQPEGFPDNLFDTLFSTAALGNGDILAIGINTYAVYVNFTSRNNGPSYEAWERGTFTGELIVDGQIALFDNYIDIDGDGSDDLIVALTIEGIINQGDGFGAETSPGLLGIPIIDKLWIKPTFQWKVEAINLDDPLWGSLKHLEVSLMKGLAFDITLDDSESYGMVVDTRFTQPPYRFTLGIGIDRIEFDVSAQNVLQLALGTFFNTLNSSELALTSISAPFSVQISNPNEPGSSLQNDCQDPGYFDPFADNIAESDEHKCGFGVGVGFIRFDGDGGGSAAPVLEMSYLDAGFHPEVGETTLPSEVDITIRNDNLGENTFDTVEIFSDLGSDVYLHYYEDRSNVTEGDSEFGNTTDARVWIHGLPSGTMPTEEIASYFTMLGEAPGSANLPGDVPSRLSWIIGIKNFSGDNTGNVDDPTLPINPVEAPNTLIAIAGTEKIDRLEYKSTFKRGGFDTDASSLQIEIEQVPEVIIIEGSFLVSPTGIDRVNFDNPNLNSIAQILDNALLSVVEVVLDIGEIVNSLPDSIVSTAGSSGGTLELHCFSQVKGNIGGSPRTSESIGRITFAFSSNDHPWIPDTDHLLISQDSSIDQVLGKQGPVDPLVPVAMSLRIAGISDVIYSYDPDTNIRDIEVKGDNGGPLLMGHIKHDGLDLESAITQSALFSNRPSSLQIIQTSDDLTYQASSTISSITYGGKSPTQQNAIKLNGLPTNFGLVLGDTLGYSASESMESIQIQLSNATNPVTMDGDHFRFWVDEDNSEASMSLQISDVLSLKRFSPQVPNATGPEGNSQIELIRTQSSPFHVLLEDQSNYEDSFLGMNGRIAIDPLPSNITLEFPSGVDSSGLELPNFDEGEGVEALSFFLGDLVDFGSSVNDVVYDFIKDLAGTEDDEEDFALGLNLLTGESFNLSIDVRKGDNFQEVPDWAHGISANIFEATVIDFNVSRMPSLTQSSKSVIDAALVDFKIDSNEQQDVLNALLSANITQFDDLVMALEDGVVYGFEMNGLNLTQLDSLGIELEFRRSWHTKIWLPQLPAGTISLNYDFRMIDNIPTYEIDMSMSQWNPLREQISIIINGIEGRDMSLVIDGLDTSKPNDVSANAVFFTQDNLTVPRFTVDMNYDLGSKLDSIHGIFIDRIEKTRVETLIDEVPQSMDFSATIGDIFIIDLAVPDEFMTESKTSIDKLMIQQLRFVDGYWWPATAFMRNLPGIMSLSAVPDNEFNIREDTSFQGMMTLDYTSNAENMDLYLEAAGRAVDYRGDVLMIAQGLPSTFKVDTTEDWGMRVASSGEGVRSLYMKQSNMPVMPGVTVQRVELIGQDLKSATIHVHRGPYEYPVIILDDITEGRIVASAQVTSQPGYYVDIFGEKKFDGRAVMLDTQMTGPIPTASSLGINGVVADLSVVGTITGGAVETRHILLVEPMTSMIASGLAMLG
ncbi:MAG: hypothetical protein CBE08_002270 [Euryarchaeota archaeon TMED248]|nr:MAG: hypothetical protein CBE08_002270 [Euryarchaeota archaeon TMED248]